MEYNENELKKMIEDNIVFSDFKQIEKKTSRGSFAVIMKYARKKKEFFVEIWSKEMFYKMYEGPNRAFFAEQVFVDIVEELKRKGELNVDFESTEEMNEKVNHLFVEILYGHLLKSDAYIQKQKEKPGFRI